MRRKRPGEDPPRMLIHEDREVAPRLTDIEISDLADPHLIRAHHRGGPESIRVACILVLDIGRPPLRAARPHASTGATRRRLITQPALVSAWRSRELPYRA